MAALRSLATSRWRPQNTFDLVHDDFQQGETLAGLTPENAVQWWVADRLRHKQGRFDALHRRHKADEALPCFRPSGARRGGFAAQVTQ
jgi:hypothetical protein